jgi:hypothetical protein
MTSKRGRERIKIATFASPLSLIKQGSLHKLDAQQRTIQNEIESFRERFFHFEARCKGLVANFQILKPLLKNQLLKSRLVRQGKGRIGWRLALVLFDACIVDCCALLEDKDRTNPSLRALVYPLLKGNRHKNRELLQRLEVLCSEPNSMNRRRSAARRRRFDQDIERLTLNWGRPYESLPKTRNHSQQVNCSS